MAVNSFVCIFTMSVLSSAVYSKSSNQYVETHDSVDEVAFKHFKTHDISFFEVTSSASGRQLHSTLRLNYGHESSIKIRFTAFNTTFSVNLHQNRFMLSSSYIEKIVTRSSQYQHRVNPVTDLCYYIGRVTDNEDSTAAFSTCHGISGYVALADETYYIEPQSNDVTGRHYIFRESDSTKPPSKCGVEALSDGMKKVRHDKQHSFTRLKKRSFNWPQDLDGQTRVVEVYIVNSHAQFIYQRSNAQQVASRTKSIINVMNSLFESLNIYFVLVGVEIWTDAERMTVDLTNSTRTLLNFQSYRANNINPSHSNDIAFFITNSSYSGQVVGKTAVGSMCSYRSAAAIISDIFTAVGRVATTMAHETGHSFGLYHDTDVGCSCDYTSSNWIMCPSSNVNLPTQWSSCSIRAFMNVTSMGSDYCLKNIPTTLYDTAAYCGNGLVENGEQCDCGVNPISQECNAGCCDSNTCQLIGSAKCAAGRCCDISSCQLRSSGYQCRSSSGVCDLSEYCNGVDSVCPSDVYKRDSTTCSINGVAAYCYQGQCQSHESQCQLLWGANATTSIDYCYRAFNTRGVPSGNCGVQNWINMTYVPCAVTDVFCGQLQCTQTTTLNSFATYALQTSFQSYPNIRCNSVVLDVGTQRQSPSLVPNGAKCDDNKMCVFQKCRNISSLNYSSCPAGCNGNGVCNSLGQCHCNNGYDPASNCSQHGCGGSIHSGPATSNCMTTQDKSHLIPSTAVPLVTGDFSASTAPSSSQNVGLIVGLCILFIVVIPSILIAAVCLYIHRHKLRHLTTNKRSLTESSVTTTTTYNNNNNSSTTTDNHSSTTAFPSHQYVNAAFHSTSAAIPTAPPASVYTPQRSAPDIPRPVPPAKPIPSKLSSISSPTSSSSPPVPPPKPKPRTIITGDTTSHQITTVSATGNGKKFQSPGSNC